ncbi:LysR family transcriptional regulator [Rhizobiales bacterium RZME27]|uniref:LysR family transcriptional regulator n=1 Tax=Endobacterium cereale TaxID=2663029 RepID=A0A6A8A252_9HYPH|nr:LysR family transcriptional regulator [Endobacterium cereale]
MAPAPTRPILSKNGQVGRIAVFVRLVESGSLSQAARELSVGQPTISKQVAALERRLGAPLLSRTPRALRPTRAGIDFYEAAVRVPSDLDDAESRSEHGHDEPKGTVRVAVPPILTSMIIVPKLPEFYRRCPDVAVEFIVSERYADLMQEGLDLAIRVGHLIAPDLWRAGSAVCGLRLSPAQLISQATASR